jgi:Fe-S-cluster containining protein
VIQKLNHKWYAGGLCFECTGCGECCAGPAEGYIWITRPEIERTAKFLKMSEEQFRKKFLRRVGFRTSIIEHPTTKDCIFLTDFGGGRRGCAIYPVRPMQCRTWPFWKENLRRPNDWNLAAMKCPGINRGPMFTLEQIEAKRDQKQWWDDNEG